MRKFVWSALAALGVATGSPGLAKSAPDAGPSVILSNPELKVFGVVGDKSVELTPGLALPYRVGAACYNWRLTFAPVAGDVELDEVLILPAPARNWSSGGGTMVDRDRKSARTHLVVDGRGGMTSRGWCVAEDDPEGEYQYVIFSGGRIVGWVRFQIGGKVV